MEKNLLEKKIGFVGTGMMGEPMAGNLLKAGLKVTVYDIRREPTKNLLALGAKVAQNASEMASCDIVFIMVNTSAQIEDVLLGEEGITRNSKRNQLLIVIMSTVSPIFIKKLADRIASTNIAIIDAPVSGGSVGAKHGLLTFMIGGQAEIITSVKPYLQVMGKNIFHVGPLGSGLAMKLINNLMVTTNMYLLPEALKIGLKAGLDVKTMVEILRVSTGNTWLTDQWSSYLGVLDMLLKNPTFHETMKRINIKDVETALEFAEELKCEAPVLRALFPGIKSVTESAGVITEELFSQMAHAKIETKR